MEKTKHLPVEELLKFHWSGELPVNTMFIALDSKVRVMATSKVCVHHIDVDEPNDSYVILVNNNLSRELMWYTIAHCLGHIHCGHLEDRRYLNNDQDHIQRFEEEANEYARQLIAPAFALNIFKEKNITNPEKIAEKLQVSEDVIKKQLTLLAKN